MKPAVWTALFGLILVLSFGCTSDDSSTHDNTDGDRAVSDGDEDGSEDDLSSDGDLDAEPDGAEGAEAEDGDAEAFEEEAIEYDVPDTPDPSVCALAEPVDSGAFDPAYIRVTSGNRTQDKNFYLLTLFDGDAALRQAIRDDDALTAIGTERDGAFRNAECGEDRGCWGAALKWEEDDIRAAGQALAALFTNTGATLAADHLRPSGLFFIHREKTDAELIAAAWADTANGMNEAFDDFSGDPAPARMAEVIEGIKSDETDFLFHQPLLRTVMALMAESDRDEAGRYEPLVDGENKAAFETLATIDWDAYPFSIMLVPGMGPDNLEEALDPAGATRCDLVAERYRAGLAPLILTSGGHVHPDRTPYCEAIEMKKYLMQEHGIPESAILVDPHARHTTTNLRNGARTILRLGLPANKPAMSVTDVFQSAYILSLDSRCLRELGYVPHRSMERMSETDNCWLPDPTSLWADPRDPLDP